jgi:hypothetical protein
MRLRRFGALLILLVCGALLAPPVPVRAGEGLAGLCPAAALFVSDNPEAVRSTRGLFYADTGTAQCFRLLYHHENADPGSPMAIQVWVRDEAAVPARLALTLGAGGPALDPMTAGHRAMMSFWRGVLSDSAVALTIAPHEWKPLVMAVLEPHEVISGLAQVRLASGRLSIVVLAYLPGASDADIAPSSFLARVGTHPFGVFASPLIKQHLEARLDQPRGLVLAGNGFLRDPRLRSALKGNYGVIYHLRLDCINPFHRPLPVAVDFMPLHGPAAGTLVLDGRLIEVPPQRLDARAEVARITVPPGRRALDIWISPEGASAYPIRLDFLPADVAER